MKLTTTAALAALLLTPLSAHAEEAKAPVVTINGMVDSYFTLNLDQPQSYASPTSGFEGAYSAEPGFNLNFAKLAGTVDAGVGGAKLEVGFGKQGLAVGDILVQQAYATLKLGPATVDFGRWYTPAGFELFDPKDNWSYSRGLLYNFAIPTAHEGVRVAVPVTEQLTLTGSIANGSDLYTNDVGASKSPYKTGIVSVTYTRDTSFGAVNLFLSKDPATGEDVWLADLVVSQGFGPLSLAVEGDYGEFGPLKWMGVGGWAKFAITDALRAVARVEWYNDDDGHHSGIAAPNLMSFTGGLNCGVGTNVDLRAEVRVDTADVDVYGATTPSGTMPTFTVGAIAWF